MSGGFDEFRRAVAEHVPGFPAGATEAFDITRHGPLDHVQRVLLRTFVLDSSPFLEPGACDAALTLGRLADLWRSASEPLDGPLPLGRSAATWSTPRVRLAPVDARHYGPLYLAATDPIDGYRWRWRGRTPSPEEFQQTLFNGVKTQFVVESTVTGDLIGLVVAYDEDPACRHCFVGFHRAGASGVAPGGMVEGMGLFVSYLFRSFPYERLLFDLPEYNMPLLEGCVPSLLAIDATIADYFTHGGRRWDRCFLSFARATWEPLAAAFFDDAPVPVVSGVHRGDA